jgi:hypothetical protein
VVEVDSLVVEVDVRVVEVAERVVEVAERVVLVGVPPFKAFTAAACLYTNGWASASSR